MSPFIGFANIENARSLYVLFDKAIVLLFIMLRQS